MLKDIIEETQKKLTEKFLGINTITNDAWHTSIYEQKAQQIDEIVAETAQIVAREVAEKILYELHSYNTHSDCDPEWHAGFSEAIDKVEEIQTTLQFLKEELSGEVLSK
jgi:hypothetical protein